MPERDLTTLAAGRELDALVAERVMDDPRWDVVIEGCSRGGRICTSVPEADAYRMDLSRRFVVGPIVCHDSVPRYSTDIAAAWLVVGRMQPTHWMRIIIGSRGVTGTGVVNYEPWADVEIGVYPTGRRGSREVARHSGPLDEVPAMICRAALSAVEGSAHA